jgi:hypothetical protein
VLQQAQPLVWEQQQQLLLLLRKSVASWRHRLLLLMLELQLGQRWAGCASLYNTTHRANKITEQEHAEETMRTFGSVVGMTAA